MVDELEEGKDLYLFSLDHFMHIFQVLIGYIPGRILKQDLLLLPVVWNASFFACIGNR